MPVSAGLVRILFISNYTTGNRLQEKERKQLRDKVKRVRFLDCLEDNLGMEQGCPFILLK